MRMPWCLVLLSGCSLILSRGPHNATPAEDPTCRESYVPPIVDTVVAAGLGAAMTAFIVDTQGKSGLALASDNLAIGVTAPLTALFIVSGIIGYVKVTHCRQAQDEHRAYLAAPQH